MTTLREAAQDSLRALLLIQPQVRGAIPQQDVEDAIDALKAALAEPEQEPVAWMVYTLDGKSVCVTDNPADFTDEHKVLPLYTAPPQQPNPDRIHSCSYYCMNPACIKAQRDELRDKLENMKGNPNEDVQGYGV